MRRVIKHIIAIIVISIFPYILVTIFAVGIEGLLKPNLLVVFAVPFALIVIVFFAPIIVVLEAFGRLKVRYTALLGFLLTFIFVSVLSGLSMNIEKITFIAMFSLLFGLTNGAIYGYIVKNA